MSTLQKLLRDYRCDGRLWMGTAFVPFWHEELEFYIHSYQPEPTARQVDIVAQILKYPHDLRADFEKRIFDYYQENVYGAIDFGSPEDDEACDPKLTESSQI